MAAEADDVFCLLTVEEGIIIAPTSNTDENEVESMGSGTWVMPSRNDSHCCYLLHSLLHKNRMDDTESKEVELVWKMERKPASFFRALSTWFLEPNQLQPELRAFCFQCVYSMAVRTNITSSDSVSVGANVSSTETGSVQCQREELTPKSVF